MCLIHLFSLYLPPAQQLTHVHVPVHNLTCGRRDKLKLTRQESPEGKLHDWTSVQAKFQILDQSEAISLCSPHQHLIRCRPMSLRFLVHLAAPCKECNQHHTGFVDHIRVDKVLPICPSFFRIITAF